jgi:hypothetical protein
MNDAPVLSSRPAATRRISRLHALALIFALLLLFVSPSYAADPSIYEFIKSRIDSTTGTLQPNAITLPDEPVSRRYSRIRWVPGALEGLGTRHMKWDGSEKASRAARLLELIATGNDAAEPALYELLRADDVVTFYNDALDLAAARIRDPEPELHDMARRFATESADRGPVKFGIALLGSFGDEHDLEIVQTLALHEEFGLYAAEALAEVAPDRQHALYEMARKLNGWGRIEAVSRMVATSDPALRRWLLTEGFRNTVTPQYLAYQCATIADLAGMLQELPPKGKPDLPLLIGASDLMQSLIKPGPAAGFNKYADAAAAAAAFLRNIQKRRESVSFYLTALALRDYVAALPAAAPAASAPRADVGPAAPDGTSASAPAPETDSTDVARWTADEKRDVAALAARIANDSSWHRHVVAAILNDDTDLDQAEAAAEKLNIQTFDLHLRRLARHSTNPRRWELAFAAAGTDDVQRLVDVAQGTSGAALEAVLRGVARHPGSGMNLVETSLTDSDDRVRQAAVETLVRWGGPYLRNVSVRSALNNAAQSESDEALKARIVALLNLGTLP